MERMCWFTTNNTSYKLVVSLLGLSANFSPVRSKNYS